MKAIIMAGGRGSRLESLTNHCPKPMLPVLNQPILAHLLNLLKRHHIHEVIITVQYMADQIEDFFGDGRDFGLVIHYAREERPLGTAGGVKNAQPYLNKRPFLIISGDAITDIDLNQARQFHHAKRSLVTLILTKVDDPRPYGLVMTDQHGRIKHYQEKPTAEAILTNTVNTGIYIMEPSVLNMMEPNVAYDFSYDIFPQLLAQNDPLFGYLAAGYWRDIGSRPHYQAAITDALAGKVNLTPQKPPSIEWLWRTGCNRSSEAAPVGLLPPLLQSASPSLKPVEQV